MFWMASCDDDDEIVDLDAPIVTAPSATSVQVGNSTTLDFSVAAAAGYASSTVSATGGTATIAAEPNSGDTQGTVTVEFTANTTAGAGSVVLIVTDGEGDTDDATAVINVSASAVPVISGIPASASVVAENQLGPVDATIDMDDVPGTLTITKDGEAFATVDITADDQVVPFTYTPTIDESGSDITFEFTATDSDGDTDVATHVLNVEIPNIPVKVIDFNIASDYIFHADSIYELAGRITVLDGATLTINAGTVIKGQPGTGANSSALLIARGGVLNANGEANAPIIMTSTSDDIIPGQIISPNLDPDVNGLWGGLIVLGNAPIAASASEVQIEGIPSTDTNGLYGGSDAADNSGSISYLSLRHGGTNIGAGNEINGISLGGVGTGTTISHVEVVANQDDGIEWFGGTVDVSNALVWNAGDDALDTDQDWVGTCDNFIIVTPQGSAFELDGPEGGNQATGVHTFSNGTVYAGDDIDDLVDWDDNTNAELQNVYFFGWSTTYTDGISSYGGDGNGVNSGWEYTLTSGGNTAADIFTGVPTGILTEVSGPGAATVGADVSEFDSWSWASVSAALSGLGL